jgi:hypothetical protein
MRPKSPSFLCVTTLPRCLKSFPQDLVRPEEIYTEITARLKVDDSALTVMLTRVFYAIGSPESFRQLKVACTVVRKRHGLSVPADDGTGPQSPQALGSKALRALDKLDVEASVQSNLRRDYLANLVRDRGHRQNHHRDKGPKMRPRILSECQLRSPVCIGANIRGLAQRGISGIRNSCKV